MGDLETKFRGISNEVLSKCEWLSSYAPVCTQVVVLGMTDTRFILVDDMAERCDRLEAELLMKEAIIAESSGTTGKGKAHDTD